ncbi:hypothetical protein CRYUN_Cryun10bG0094200 [Craigia yunnanensis]
MLRLHAAALVYTEELTVVEGRDGSKIMNYAKTLVKISTLTPIIPRKRSSNNLQMKSGVEVPICYNLPENHVALFIFGDSLFDPGNNNYINTTFDFQANFWPYGETFFKYPTGRFSDGRLIPDFIAQFAGLPIIPTYLQPGNHKFTNGVNFASGGAGALVESHQGKVVDLETQIKYFKKVEKSLRQEIGDAEAKKLLSRAVYFISIGGNDYLTRNSSASDEEFASMVLGNLTVALKEIYKKGGRKFGFPNMMLLGCLPYMKAQAGSSCNDEVTAIAKLHNVELPKILNKIENQLEGLKFQGCDDGMLRLWSVRRSLQLWREERDNRVSFM